MENIKSDIELNYLSEYNLGNTQLTYKAWLKHKIQIYKEELYKQEITSEEVQEFSLGNIAYMIDDDFRFFESTVNKIELKDGHYYYETSDVDFEYKDIGDWVFKSDAYREIHLESKFIQ